MTKTILENLLRLIKRGKFEISGGEIPAFHQLIMEIENDIKALESMQIVKKEEKKK